jgi:hypothetical protein
VHWWPACAPLLEETWNRFARDASLANEDATRALLAAGRQLAAYLVRTSSTGAPQVPNGDIPGDVAADFVTSARTAGAISCAQSIATAMSFLQSDSGMSLASDFGSMNENDLLDLRYLREGQTSSIFAINAAGHDSPNEPAGVVRNVARDHSEAAADLRSTGDQLAFWATREPASVAMVHATGHGTTIWFGALVEIAVLAVRQIADARELHVVRDPAEPTRALLVEVDHFRHDQAVAPLVAARHADCASSDRLWSQVVAARTALAHIDWQTCQMLAPQLDLNDGDVVSSGHENARHVVLVGSAAKPWSGPLGAWPYEAMLASARDNGNRPGARLFWQEHQLALRAVHHGLQRAFGEPTATHSFDRMLSAAQSLDPTELSHIISNWSPAIWAVFGPAMQRAIDNAQDDC